MGDIRNQKRREGRKYTEDTIVTHSICPFYCQTSLRMKPVNEVRPKILLQVPIIADIPSHGTRLDGIRDYLVGIKKSA